EGAHARAPALIDFGAARNHARGFLGGFGVRHLGFHRGAGTIDPRAAYTTIMNKKRRRAVSPPVRAYRWPAGAGQRRRAWIPLWVTPRVSPARDRGRPRPAPGRRPNRRSAAASRAPKRGRRGYGQAAP